MDLAAQARSAANAQQMLDAMPLNELRQARELSQKILADVLHLQQMAIAKKNGKIAKCCAWVLKPTRTESIIKYRRSARCLCQKIHICAARNPANL
jgi:hypothetical protein